MKILKNKFFIIISSIIFMLFLLQFYYISNSYKRDTNSYVVLVKWAWTLTTSTWKKVLALNSKEKLNNWDIINTLKDSLAVIEWWDKSITRLGWNTKIKIKENFILEDLSKINISFELLKWKTWSNIVSIMIWNSNFTQEIKWNVASVRWTVFETNYEEDYLVVHKHEVEIMNNTGWIKKIYWWQAFSFKQFSLENIIWKIDETFAIMNKELDKEYIKKLREDFMINMKDNRYLNLIKNFYYNESNIYNMLLSFDDPKAINDYILSLPEEKKEKIIKYLTTLNQTLNFENWENSELYNIKLNIRSVLLNNLNDENYKETLVKYSSYDLLNIFSLENINNKIIENTFSLLLNNKKYIEDIKNSINWWNQNIIKDLLNINNSFDLTHENINNKLLEFNSKWKDIINDWLNKLLEFYTK